MAQKQITVGQSLVAVVAGSNTWAVNVGPIAGNIPGALNVYDANQNLIAVFQQGGPYTFNAPFTGRPFFTGQIVGYVAFVAGTAVLNVSDSNQAIGVFPEPVQVLSANGAISILKGIVMITKGSAAALTLPQPAAGTNDGNLLRIVGTTAFAHTVTTSALGINGTKDTATFANAGDSLYLVAYGGVWYTLGTTTTTLSEV